jgi:phosphoribosylformylglycinamidine synthase
MDVATICAKELRKRGKLKALDVSDENNACSINVDVKIGNKFEKYLLMFKNETHNHPTEIEPFGGAATCLGGAIRDPLSGRTYVYQAMRVTGSADPTTSLSETLPNKLSQRNITLGAAKGYSSYGNQIGLATGQVDEIYHPGYVAKRMEIGAVIGAAPKANVVRKTPQNGDVIILLGGRTGKDGIGGATGSSKSHTVKSIDEGGAEVQKGNPICERKIQRLFRNPCVTRLIKKCNDFGAGGVSVTIGELCPGMDINLNAVPKKYQGLNGTEIAISESQERMAVVVNAKDQKQFIKLAQQENLEATVVAKVTNTNHLRMY